MKVLLSLVALASLAVHSQASFRTRNFEEELRKQELTAGICQQKGSSPDCSSQVEECLTILGYSTVVKRRPSASKICKDSLAGLADCLTKISNCITLLELTNYGVTVDDTSGGSAPENVPRRIHGSARSPVRFNRRSLRNDSSDLIPKNFTAIQICSGQNEEDNCISRVERCHELIGPGSNPLEQEITGEMKSCYRLLRRLQNVSGGSPFQKRVTRCETTNCHKCKEMLLATSGLNTARMHCLFQVSEQLSLMECMKPSVEVLVKNAIENLGLPLKYPEDLEKCTAINDVEAVYPCLMADCIKALSGSA